MKGCRSLRPLPWRDVPPGVAAFALILDDPDAPPGLWIHWVLHDLPGELRELPPPGAPHHYHFHLSALDRRLDLPPGASAAEVRRAMAGHVLAEAEPVGLYQTR